MYAFAAYCLLLSVEILCVPSQKLQFINVLFVYCYVFF
jgi:hypothetical protein